MAKAESRYRPDPKFLRALARVLKLVRGETKQTQEALAKACNISWRYLQEIEASEATPDHKLKNPSIGVFLALSEGLDLTATELMNRVLTELAKG